MSRRPRSTGRPWPSVWSSTLRRKVALGGAAVALLLAFTLFVPPSTPGPIERDFEAYYSAGATVDAGGDPFSRAIWTAEQRIPGVPSTRDELLPFVSPAATLPFWALLARFPYRTGLAAWTAILIGAYFVVLLCALRLARAARKPFVYAVAAATAIAAAPMLGDFALGQAALVSAAGVAAAIVAYRERSRAAALAATLLSALQPNLALTLLGRVRSRWDAAVATAGAVIFAGITFVAGGGAHGLFSYVARLRAHGAAERFVTIQHTPAAIAYALGAAAPVASSIGATVAIGALVATVIVVVRARLDPTTATLVCCAALPLAIPFFHEHDFVLEVLPVLVLAVRARGRTRGLAGIAAMLILVDWFGLAQRHFAQGQIVCLGLAVAFGFWGLGHERSRNRWQYTGFLTLGVLAAIAVPLGRAHPAPTWPDALPPAYRAAANADASGVWADEQRASGLDAVDPVWGVLRSLPLTGCVLLGIALVAQARDEERRRSRRRRAPALTVPASWPVVA